MANQGREFRDPFNPSTGEFAANIRDVAGGDDTELRESLKAWGWLKELPALADERGLVLIGNRRMAIAKELGIEPVTKTLQFGDGDEADAERLKLAIASNIGARPLTRADRKRIAEYLYGKDWSMERIGTALNVSQRTISDDLVNLEVTSKLKSPAKTADNPKGAGRPKGSGKLKPRTTAGPPAVRKRKQGDAETRAASMVLDQGKGQKEAADEVGLKSRAATRMAVEFELGRREALADPVIDPATLSQSAQERLAAAIRQEKRRMEIEYVERVRAASAAESRLFIATVWLPMHRKKLERAERVIAERQGVMDKATYTKIMRCLHPDRVEPLKDAGLTKEYNEAFSLWRESAIKVMSEKEDPILHQFPGFPDTVEELVEQRRRYDAEKAASRAEKKRKAA